MRLNEYKRAMSIKGGEKTQKAYCPQCKRNTTWMYVAGTLSSHWKCTGCGANRPA
ncbi:MAG: hypothetical protein M3384_08005 [Acidobacteriota bacterium]|nr:hypothetical protein [Acidobacteriota bacterium]